MTLPGRQRSFIVAGTAGVTAQPRQVFGTAVLGTRRTQNSECLSSLGKSGLFARSLLVR